jgi:O-methyltransferase involved in polyketide biosynthesis
LTAYDPTLGDVVPEGTAEPTRWFLDAATYPGMTAMYDAYPVRAFARMAETWTLPGISVHNALRKRWIEDAVREALASGRRQVLVLGAGFDTLAYRLHGEYPDVRWWEIDHPATQSVKRDALDDHGGVGDNFDLVAADFSETTLGEVLGALADEASEGAGGSDRQERTAYDPTAPTVVVAEGLLMYLSEEEVRALFRDVRRRTGPGSRVVGTALEPREDGRLTLRSDNEFGNRLLEVRLGRLGEPLRWGIEPTALPTFVDDLGFESTETLAVEDLRGRYLPPEARARRLPRGEYLFRTTRGE